jgi:hypothetical protein
MSALTKLSGGGNIPRWTAGLGIQFVGNGSALAEAEAAKRVSKPWLFGQNAAEGLAQRIAYTAPIGVPLAVKIGLCIGQARRQYQLSAARAHSHSALANGLICDTTAAAIDEAIELKRNNLGWHVAWWQKITTSHIEFPVRPEARPERFAHRSMLAACSPTPPELARDFTSGQLAVLKIIADEVARTGDCRLSNKEISDRAQMCRRGVRYVLARAKGLQLLKVQERKNRVPMHKNQTNVITIISALWLRWVNSHNYKSVKHLLQLARRAAKPFLPQSNQINKTVLNKEFE